MIAPVISLLELCDLVSISQDNKLSIIGIFDKIVVNTLPTIHPKMSVVAVISGETDSTHQVTLLVKDPTSAKKIVENTVQAKLGAGGRTNIMIDLVSFPLETAGEYTIEILSDNKFLGKRKFSVTNLGGQGNGTNGSKRASN
jgi:hypothetical protein